VRLTNASAAVGSPAHTSVRTGWRDARCSPASAEEPRSSTRGRSQIGRSSDRPTGGPRASAHGPPSVRHQRRTFWSTRPTGRGLAPSSTSSSQADSLFGGETPGARCAASPPVLQVILPRACHLPPRKTAQGTRRLAAAVILCSGVEGHGRPSATVLARFRSTRTLESPRADT